MSRPARDRRSGDPSPAEPEPCWPGARVRDASRPEHWTDLISHSFIPLLARPIGDGPFFGRLHTIRRGPIGLARIEGSAQHVRRGKQELARSGDEAVYFNIQLAGMGHVRNRLGDVATTVGHGVIVPSFEAFELGFERQFTQLCVSMRADWLTDRLGMPLAALATRGADLTQGVGRVVRAALGAIIEADRPEEWDTCADLFAQALAGTVRQAGPGRGGSPGRRALIEEVKRLIAHRLGDAQLTPGVAARALGCSLSTLHLHCQRTGRSFGAMLLEARLLAAAQALLAHPVAHGRVEFVAFACGFTDPSHFSRKFRERFGVPPGQYR